MKIYLIYINVAAEAITYTLVIPRRDSMLVWFVDKEERARVNGGISVLCDNYIQVGIPE